MVVGYTDGVTWENDIEVFFIMAQNRSECVNTAIGGVNIPFTIKHIYS